MISVSFFAVIIIMAVIYYVVPKKFQTAVIMFTGAVILGIYSPVGLGIVVIETLIAFITAKSFLKIEKEIKKRVLLFCVIALYCIVWVTVKKLAPSTGNLSLFETYDISEITVTFGISYFVLRLISYTVDAYKGKIKAENNYFRLLLYITYFPTLLEGPIERYDKFIDKALEPHFVRYDNFRNAGQCILFGFFKVYVISKYCAFFSQYINNPGDKDSLFLILCAAMYSVQIYTDFSGSIDILRGVSYIFGIELSENFRRPYFSCDFGEFWDRWHITFSKWLKDYIYIPLGGNRKGKTRQYINIFVVFIVSGLWHGISVHFVVWGLIHAAYQVIEKLLYKKKRKPNNENSLIIYLLNTIKTSALATFAWVFFCGTSMTKILEYFSVTIKRLPEISLKKLIDSVYQIDALEKVSLLYIFLIIIFCIYEFLADRYNFELFSSSVSSKKVVTVVRWCGYLFVLSAILMLGFYGDTYDAQSFIYGGF